MCVSVYVGRVNICGKQVFSFLFLCLHLLLQIAPYLMTTVEVTLLLRPPSESVGQHDEEPSPAPPPRKIYDRELYLFDSLEGSYRMCFSYCDTNAVPLHRMYHAWSQSHNIVFVETILCPKIMSTCVYSR